MTAFFHMDGYVLYIWASYAIAFSFVLGAAVHSWMAARRTLNNTPE